MLLNYFFFFFFWFIHKIMVENSKEQRNFKWIFKRRIKTKSYSAKMPIFKLRNLIHWENHSEIIWRRSRLPQNMFSFCLQKLSSFFFCCFFNMLNFANVFTSCLLKINAKKIMFNPQFTSLRYLEGKK